MKRIYIIIFLASLMVAPITPWAATAQTTKKERIAKRNQKKKRKVRRTSKRVSRRAHIHYASLTRYSATVKVVPRGAVIVKRSNMVYHYHGGLFYQKFGTHYVVVRPVAGVRVKTLPPKHIRVIIPRGTYYYFYGNYYRKAGSSYEVVGAPIGAVVDGIPDGYDIEEINGNEYYVWNDVYYEEIEAGDFKSGIGYKVTNQG